MKKKFKTGRWIVASMMAASAASAQTSDAGPDGNTYGITLGEGTVPPLNRFGLSYRAGFNISAKFKNVAGFSQLNNPGPATGGADHFYDDGYNRVDSSGNAGGLTWFWGYEHASQVPGDGFLYMHSVSSSQQSSSKDEDEDLQHGVEVSYNRQLGRVGRAFWGVEGAFNFSDLTISRRDNSGRSVTLITDAYDLVNPPPPVIPPQPPYHGTRPGPGPAIDDDPDRIVSTESATGDHEVEASFYGLRLGPYVQVPLTEKLDLWFSGGLALAMVDSEYTFQESITTPSGPPALRSGSSSEDDVLVGGYVGANISYAITESFDVFAGAQYQYLDGYSHRVSDKKASVELDKSIFLTVGIGYSF